MKENLTLPDALLLGQKVNEQITSYLSIQNDVLRFSFAKALGFRRPDPAQALTRCASVRTSLEELLNQLRHAELSDDDEKGRFLINLRGYIRSVLEGLAVFESLCTSMHRAMTTKDSRWKKETQPQLLAELQQAEQNWLAQGLKLNELWKALPQE